MIAIIDYKMGNIHSVAKAFELAGARVRLTSSARVLEKASGLILPGVGAFGAGMSHLRQRRLIEPLREMARQGKPLFGICLGMQLLFSESEEHGRYKGLDLVPGTVTRFRSGLKIPHMGWNTLELPARVSPAGKKLLAGVAKGTYFYFVHSYYACPQDRGAVLAWTEYGQRFASMVCRDNIYGAQFHPEKSSEAGLRMVKNFCRLCGETKD